MRSAGFEPTSDGQYRCVTAHIHELPFDIGVCYQQRWLGWYIGEHVRNNV